MITYHNLYINDITCFYTTDVFCSILKIPSLLINTWYTLIELYTHWLLSYFLKKEILQDNRTFQNTELKEMWWSASNWIVLSYRTAFGVCCVWSVSIGVNLLQIQDFIINCLYCNFDFIYQNHNFFWLKKNNLIYDHYSYVWRNTFL